MYLITVGVVAVCAVFKALISSFKRASSAARAAEHAGAASSDLETGAEPDYGTWKEREPIKIKHDFYGRDKAIDTIKSYVEGVKSKPGEDVRNQVMSPGDDLSKGLRICTTVGTMGIGKTVSLGWES